jgi:hypothetical protein
MSFRDLVEVIESVLTSLAILIAGVWAYYHYLKGRSYHPRIELDVSGRVVRDDDRVFLCAVVTAENVGYSKLKIAQQDTGLRVLAYPAAIPGDAPEFFGVRPQHLGTVPILAKHRWLEPNEKTSDEWMFCVPMAPVAYRVEAKVVSDHVSWTTATIVTADHRLKSDQA